MNYKTTRTALWNLINIVMDIEVKEKEIAGARAYNKNFSTLKPFDIKKIREELQELELEYNREKRNL